jgi:predicted TIM-barrel fold metal-dependent hydrolase
MIIDIHAHVYANPLIRRNPRATPFLSPEQQIAIMDAKGIDMAVILPTTEPITGAETQSLGELLQICRAYPGRFIPFCNLEPRIGKRPDRIASADFDFWLEQCREAGCRGLGELMARVRFDDAPMLALFGACERIGFPVTFHTTTPTTDSYGVLDDIGLPGLEYALKTFPRLTFLGHSQAFWSEIGGGVTPADKVGYPTGPVRPGGRLPELLRRYPGLCGDLSAGSGFNALHRDPEHAYGFLEEFQDRMLLGLDYCSVANNMQHIEWLTAARDAGHIRPDAFEKIMWRNADRILGLGLAPKRIA